MRFRPFLTDVLLHLQIAQPADRPRPKQERQQQSGQACYCRAHGNVPKHVERAEIRPQRVEEKVVEHLSRALSATPPMAYVLLSLPRADAALQSLREFFPFLRRANLSRATDPRAAKNWPEIARQLRN